MENTFSVNVDHGPGSSHTVCIHNIRAADGNMKMVSIEIDKDGNVIIFGGMTEPKPHSDLDYVDSYDEKSRAYAFKILGDKE